MKQIVKNILDSQGYSHISLFDKDKDIWLYVKDSQLFFCKSDLSIINRDSLGLNDDVLIFTESMDSIHLVKDDEEFSNFFAINKNNKIIANMKLAGKEYFSKKHNKRIQESFILIRISDHEFLIQTNKKNEECNLENYNDNYVGTVLVTTFKDDTSFFFINNVYVDDLYLCSFFKDFYFFHAVEENTVSVYQKNRGLIINNIKYTFDQPYIWKHDNSEAQLVIFENQLNSSKDINTNQRINNDNTCGVKIIYLNQNITEYTFNVNNYIIPDDLCSIDSTFTYSLCVSFLCSNNYIIIPYSSGNGAFVVKYDDKDFPITPYSISFKDSLGCHLSFKNSYLSSFVFSFKNNIIDVRESTEECVDFVNGDPVLRSHIYHYLFDVIGNRIIVEYDENKNYLVFTYNNNTLWANNTMNKGILDRRSLKIIFPPICQDIIVLDDINGFFELSYVNRTEGNYCETNGLFSAYSGFIVPFGIDYKIEDLLYNPYSSNNSNRKYVVYNEGPKKGIIYNGNKLFSSEFDDVQYGVLNNDKAYFVIEKEGKYGIISNDKSFNIRTHIDFDDVFGGTFINNKHYFYVEKDGKQGAICTEESFNVPLIFEALDRIIFSGVMCNGVVFDFSGKKLFTIGSDYKYIKTKKFDVFRSISSNDYIFINLNGKKLNYTICKENDNIIYIKDTSYYYDIEKKDVFEDDEDNYYDHYEDDYTSEEIIKMYRDAFEGDPEAEWNID